jgi:uncharacterized protein YbgA (DUF1722 family)/uncharacterized protein YbbK (DUF523 family)
MKKIPIGISSCLLGENVRFDGGNKHNAYITGTLGEFFEFHPFCPEVAIGLGIPRPTIRLVKIQDQTRCVGVTDLSLDVTDRLSLYAIEQKTQQAELCGYIFKKDSPSCGMERVKVYNNNQPHREGVGIYAQQVMANNPLLPIEEEGRLGDAGLRENFIQRVYVYHRWQTLLTEGLSIAKLTRFHAQHKLIIMSHGNYQPLGQLLTTATSENLTQVAEDYILKLMTLLKKVVTRGQHVNVLQHIQGYLKKELSSDDKVELGEIFERYLNKELPLIVPITLLKHHFRKTPDPYIEDSFYMSPYPQELNLINQL